MESGGSETDEDVFLIPVGTFLLALGGDMFVASTKGERVQVLFPRVDG